MLPCFCVFLSPFAVVNLFLVFRVDNLTRRGEMYQNLCFLLNFANCIISLAWSGEDRWVRMRSWERLEAGGNGGRKEGLVKMSVEEEKHIFHDEKRENKCLCESLMTGYNWWLCLNHWAWMVLPVYFDCFDETPDSAASPGAMAVNEWWHMFDVWLSHSKHRHKLSSHK